MARPTNQRTLTNRTRMGTYIVVRALKRATRDLGCLQMVAFWAVQQEAVLLPCLLWRRLAHLRTASGNEPQCARNAITTQRHRPFAVEHTSSDKEQESRDDPRGRRKVQQRRMWTQRSLRLAFKFSSGM